MSDHDVAAIRQALIDWGTHSGQHGRLEECLAALDRVADSLTACEEQYASLNVRLMYQRERREHAERDRDSTLGTLHKTTETAEAAEARIETLTEALRAGENYLRKISDPTCPPAARQAALDEFANRARAALGEIDPHNHNLSPSKIASLGEADQFCPHTGIPAAVCSCSLHAGAELGETDQ